MYYYIKKLIKIPQKMATQSAPTPKLNFQLIAQQYSASPWIKIAAICGASAVVLGAYGAHGLYFFSFFLCGKFNLQPKPILLTFFKGLKKSDKRAIFETANRYHFYHSLALLATPFVHRPNLVGGLFLGGMMIFSGTCYCNAITGNEMVVRFTPFGGMMFILGWLAMFI
uniref:Transmembrane protein 256 homolog isoform X2 n=1 Tax=Dermatophagoides pteronyssinus TaxID=6956 RepID=A0A6P6XSR4_DERPT|nr:transmembrane protein 256 homolog isoform X2 [Dermatophagoides pteronyssinus]